MLTTMPVFPVFLLASSSGSALVDWVFSNPFAGIHHLVLFDYAFLAPYFAILIVLSCYGCHRFEMIRRYLKHKKQLVNEPADRFDELPRVTVQLPLYNERYVVERLIEQTIQLDYPKHLLQIQVLDDSTDDTRAFTE